MMNKWVVICNYLVIIAVATSLVIFVNQPESRKVAYSRIPSPDVGTKISVPDQDSLGAAVESGNDKKLLVVLGGCAACSRASQVDLQVVGQYANDIQIILLSWSSLSVFRDYYPEVPKKVNVLCDPRQNILPNDFTYKAPAAYLFSSDWTLISMQAENESIKDFIQKIL